MEISWKKERSELQKQVDQCQDLIVDLENQLKRREQPEHLMEKLNVLMSENELLLGKMKELEIVVDNVKILKNEVQRLKDKNSSDWNYWRKQQSDLYSQLRQQINLKESVFYKFERLEKQVEREKRNFFRFSKKFSFSLKIKLIENGNSVRFVRDTSVGPISLNSFQNELNGKSNSSSFLRDFSSEEIDLPHGTIDGRPLNSAEIVGGMDDSTANSSLSNYVEHDKQKVFEKTYSAQENMAETIEQVRIFLFLSVFHGRKSICHIFQVADKIDRVEDNLFSYQRFMDFIRA